MRRVKMAYIFFDIDGTLWDEKMQIPESTIPTIKQLQKNGHKTFLCLSLIHI